MYTMIDGKPVSLGVAYGYCYHPQVEEYNGTRSGFTPAGDGKNWAMHPYCATQQEAEDWLKERGLKGYVLRYAHHEPEEDRAADYCPWVTAGIVATIEDGDTLYNLCPKYREAVDWTNRHKVKAADTPKK